MKRYACVPFIIGENLVVYDSKQLMANCTKGPWVKYTDHEKEVSRLKSEINSRIDTINDLCRKLATTESELARYKTPMVDGVEYLPSDPANHEVVE